MSYESRRIRLSPERKTSLLVRCQVFVDLQSAVEDLEESLVSAVVTELSVVLTVEHTLVSG